MKIIQNIAIVLCPLLFGFFFARGVEKYHGVEGDCSCRWHIIERLRYEVNDTNSECQDKKGVLGEI